jgi:hypothetical protein
MTKLVNVVGALRPSQMVLHLTQENSVRLNILAQLACLVCSKDLQLGLRSEAGVMWAILKISAQEIVQGGHKKLGYNFGTSCAAAGEAKEKR